jgi:hypothetical protein
MVGFEKRCDSWNYEENNCSNYYHDSKNTRDTITSFFCLLLSRVAGTPSETEQHDKDGTHHLKRYPYDNSSEYCPTPPRPVVAGIAAVKIKVASITKVNEAAVEKNWAPGQP